LLSVLKDLPLWVLLALATGVDLLFFSHWIKAQVPHELVPWLLVGVVLLDTFGLFKAVSIAMRMAQQTRLAHAARRTFHLSPDERQSFWGSTKQKDNSMTTQIVVRFAAKNLTESDLGFLSVRMIKPRIRGEVVHADVMVRAVNQNIYGTAVHSGHRVPSKELLPATTMIIIRGTPRQRAGENLPVTLGIMDEEGNEQYLELLA
jgi:hypothetical protein